MTARADLFRALGLLAEPPEPGHAAIAAALGLEGSPAPGDYAAVFLFGAYPYASVYLGAEGMLGGEARDRVAGFWRALGLSPPAEPDHLAALLGLYAALVDAEWAAHEAGDPARAALRRASRRALLWEHLLSWLSPYLAKVRDLAPPFYSAWAALLRGSLDEEAADLGPAGSMPLQLRSAPGLPAQDAGGPEWVAALLAPVRSGLLLARADLLRGAREVGIGARAGERSFMLRSMLEQDAAGTARWLVDEAACWAERHRGAEPALGQVAGFWRSRAELTGAALRALTAAREADAASAPPVRGR